MTGLMSRKCKSCCGGLITILSGAGRKQSFCHCPAGKAAEQEGLKARLLAAFHSTASLSVTVDVRFTKGDLDVIGDPQVFVQAAVNAALAEMRSAQ